MELDETKIDDATLALLYLGLHDGARAWKSFDWGAMDRLFEKDLIDNPRSKNKSVLFTEKGIERAKKLLDELFGVKGDATPPPIEPERRDWVRGKKST